ncbi:MAG: hypothetical protein FVQ82_06045 [Planctomycetes bacterium]|nr:hypothetical protein [Planctomycetota bacterium]
MTQNLLTIGQIAELLEEQPSRVAYIVSKYRLKPVCRVGIIRLFDELQIKAIKKGLFDIQIRRGY